MNYSMTILAIIAIEAVLLVRALIVLWAARKDVNTAVPQHKAADLSIVIPLKGWDGSLPTLVGCLCRQNYSGAVQVIVVADADNPHLDALPRSRQVRIRHPDPMPMGWRDKNWRLYQGVKSADYADIMFLDSDVRVDVDFLRQRLAEHRGALSYCVPLYSRPATNAERFLAAFTNYNSFYLYKTSTTLMDIATAVGPSIFVTAGRDVLLRCLEEIKGEVADDHAMAYWFQKNSFVVASVREPVYVVKDRARWHEVLSQIKRWLTLPRTILHMLMPHSAFFLLVNVTLNSLSSLFLYGGLLFMARGDSSGAAVCLLGATAFIGTETILLVAIEQAYTKRVQRHYPWSHLFFLPMALLTQPLLLLHSLFSRDIRWRGATMPLRNDGRMS